MDHLQLSHQSVLLRRMGVEAKRMGSTTKL